MAGASRLTQTGFVGNYEAKGGMRCPPRTASRDAGGVPPGGRRAGLGYQDRIMRWCMDWAGSERVRPTRAELCCEKECLMLITKRQVSGWYVGMIVALLFFLSPGAGAVFGFPPNDVLNRTNVALIFKTFSFSSGLWNNEKKRLDPEGNPNGDGTQLLYDE